MIKAVVFDCFGVVLRDVLTHTVAELKGANRDEEAAEVHGLMHAADRGIMSQDEALAGMSDILGTTKAELAERLALGEEPNRELLDFIKSLRPKYKVALMSNIASRERIAERLKSHSLDEWFDEVVVSGEVGFVKPEPEIYEITLSKLGVKAGETVFTDDIEYFCAVGEELGLHAVQFENTKQFIHDFRMLEEQYGN
jgi:putative hydrolase of the HAD superfamily